MSSGARTSHLHKIVPEDFSSVLHFHTKGFTAALFCKDFFSEFYFQLQGL